MNQKVATSAGQSVAQPEKTTPLVNWLVALAVAGAVSPWILWNLENERHFVDESAMIAQSYYYTLLKSGQRNHPDWLHYAAYDHPPLPKYFFGLALDLAGLPVPTSLGPWLNWIRGDYSPPSDRRVLFYARLPAALFGVGGVLALYSLGVQLHSRFAGALAAALLAVNPLYLTHARRAMSDSFTECLVIASVTLAVWGCRVMWNRPFLSGRADSIGRGGRWLRIAVFVLIESILCGCAALAKLNGGIATALVILMIIGFWFASLAGPRRDSGADVRAALYPSIAPALAPLAVGVCSFMVFVALNPLLTAQPELPDSAHDEMRELKSMGVLARARFLVHFRQEWSKDALANEHFRKDWLTTFPARARMTMWEGFGRFSPFGPRDIRTKEPRPESERFTEYHRVSAIIWLPLVCWGILFSCCQGWQAMRHGEPPLAWGLLLYMAASVAMVTFMIPLNWDRYYLPLQAPASLLAAIGVASTIGVRRSIAGFAF